ncbi:YjzD family protein [Oceanobacillus halotolerans]|uniref:YjzD family protein n=1 Tax=Oceanobacillus halotolerans TaxID=2663380 RepID=UPI0013DC49DF|nr:YjzD family protein [Oceanobacillus halotolerans]
MRYIATIIWAVLISGVLSYVLSSMGSEPFNLTNTLILAALFSIAIFILGDGAIKTEEE